MKHRGPVLFAAIWLLVLIVPPLRRQPWRQVVPQVRAIFQATPRDASQPFPAPGTYPGPEGRLQSAVDRAEAKESNQAVFALAALVQEHPRELWLRADTLRFGCDYTVWKSASVNPSRPRLSMQMTKRCAEIARKGALQAPDNAFFPLMQALFLVASGEDPPGMQAARRADRCSRFDDFARAEANRRLAMIELARPISWQWRMTVGFSIQLSYLIAFRGLANYYIAQGQTARKAGDTDMAWRRYEAALNVGRSLRKTPDTLNRVFVGEDIEEKVWKAALNAGKKSESVDVLAEKYAALATQWGAPVTDAKQSTVDARNSLVQRLLQRELAFQVPLPVSPLQIRAVSQGPWLAAWLASLAWIGALLWCFCHLISGVWRQTAPPRPLKWCTGFACGGLLCLFSISLWLGAGSLGTIMQISSAAQGYVQVLQRSFFLYVLILWALVPLLWWLLGLAAWWQNHHHNLASIGKALVAVPIRNVVQLLIWVSGLSLTATPLLALCRGLQFDDDLSFAMLALGAALAMALLPLVWKTWQVRGQSNPAPSLNTIRGVQGLALLGQVSGRIALASTVAYLLVVLCLWPLNRGMDHLARDYAANGEVATWLNGQ